MATKLTKTKIRTAITDEEELGNIENEAIQLAKKQIAEGTASSQIIKHFLDLASPTEKLKQERIRSEIALNKQKIKAIEQESELAAKYDAAVNAILGYRGKTVTEEELETDD